MQNCCISFGNDLKIVRNAHTIILHFAFSIKKTAAEKAAVFLNQLLLSVNGALTAILALALETDGAVNQSEQGVVTADADIDAGMDVSASLANQNVAGQNELTVSALHAQALRLGITAVLGGTAALVVSEELNTNLQHGNYTSKTSI